MSPARLSSVIALISGEVILLEGYKRYTFNGVIDGGITPKKTLKEMLSYHAIMSSTGGQYNLLKTSRKGSIWITR
jgi:hypothetical protein